ncbi:S1C family serine protease [Amycolatopsis suaedae]|uniref:PDZ domain-containing protein n=1 Tax=Amycolatopsis suaedae TaxID=2510978 RepID=A0A4Q7J968_9PSEU|nr:trypsin-like peptidase domain-containing protein [Amycolatopsis suaedae]RZQ62674.1 PDZ domain-containing protein [Amycolatopsis suaedae]
MSQQSQPQRPDPEGRLAPRPLNRPPVDPAQASAFGRPHGVQGAFDTLRKPGTPAGQANGLSLAPPTPESLAEAFRRPPEAAGVVLQRPADDPGAPTSDTAEPPLWTETADPWRDPGAAAVLGSPAARPETEPEKKGEDRPRGRRLSLSEVLFGRTVKPIALGILAALAVVIGAAGGLTGWWLADEGDSLTGELNIAEAEAAKERPAGSVAEVAQRVTPAVVYLEVVSGQEGGSGSGVVIDPAGYILTNHHVVARAVQNQQAKINVEFVGGTRTEAQLVGSDPKTDLAVIKVNVPNLVAIQVGKSGDLAVGDTVLAVGSPRGYKNSVTQGIVSALNRPTLAPGLDGGPPVAMDAVQTDAAINPGNSGGALVDATGALVGINTLIATAGDSDGNIGIGFAIPVDYAIRISSELTANRQVKHAEIGINAASVAGRRSMGAQVQNVVPNGPAASAGIAEGDVITKVGDRTVAEPAELTVAVRQHDPGAVVPVQLVRQGRQLVVDVTLGSD